MKRIVCLRRFHNEEGSEECLLFLLSRRGNVTGVKISSDIRLCEYRHKAACVACVDGEVDRTPMEAIMTQDFLNWSLLGLLLLWMIVFAVLAFRPGKNENAKGESQVLDAGVATASVEPQARKTQPQLVAVQHEARRYRPHNTGEVEAVTI